MIGIDGRTRVQSEWRTATIREEAEMLRRDVEYVLTWDAQAYGWLARPLIREGDRIVKLGSSWARLEPSLARLAGSGEWSE